MADNNDAETETEEEFTYHAQATHHPDSEIEGEIIDVKLSANVDGDAEQTGHGIGIVFKNPTLKKGDVWAARTDLPDEFDTIREYNDTLELAKANPEEDSYAGGEEVTEANVNGAREELKAYGVDYEDAETISGTDYKVATGDYSEHSVQEYDGNIISIDVSGGAYEADKQDEFDHDTVMVWYGGVSGQFAIRGLDFNGLFFANHDNGSFTKGILQVARGWRSGDTKPPEVNGDAGSRQARGHLASSEDRGGLGRAPRVARPIVLRPDVRGERISIELDDNRYITLKDADGNELGLRNAYDEDEDVDGYIEEQLDVDDAASVYEMYYGEGWEDKPESTSNDDTDNSGSSFDIDSSGADEAEADEEDESTASPASLTEKEEEFAEMVVESITGQTYEGRGVRPDDPIFGDGVTMAELAEQQKENFDTDDPNIEAIEAFVYENTSHLDEADAVAA